MSALLWKLILCRQGFRLDLIAQIKSDRLIAANCERNRRKIPLSVGNEEACYEVLHGMHTVRVASVVMFVRARGRCEATSSLSARESVYVCVCVCVSSLLQLLVYAVPACIICVLATVGMRSSSPPTPPSASADSSSSEPFFKGIKLVRGALGGVGNLPDADSRGIW